MAVIKTKCKKCHALIDVNQNWNIARCPYCNTTFSIKNLNVPNASYSNGYSVPDYSRPINRRRRKNIGIALTIIGGILLYLGGLGFEKSYYSDEKAESGRIILFGIIQLVIGIILILKYKSKK